MFFFFSSRRRHTRCSRDWSSDVCSSDLDYCPISCERGDTLFSVQPVPPSQGDAKLAALRGATQRGGAALAVALVLLALVAPAGGWRWPVVLPGARGAAPPPPGASVRTAGPCFPPPASPA